MGKRTYIRLVSGSKQNEISLHQIKELFTYYQEMTQNTGQRLDWDYRSTAFPYQMEDLEQEGTDYLILKGINPKQYHSLVVGTGQDEDGISYLQIILPTQSTHGDLAKANEFAKFLAKQLQGELHLFNGRIIYYNSRKG